MNNVIIEKSSTYPFWGGPKNFEKMPTLNRFFYMAGFIERQTSKIKEFIESNAVHGKIIDARHREKYSFIKTETGDIFMLTHFNVQSDRYSEQLPQGSSGRTKLCYKVNYVNGKLGLSFNKYVAQNFIYRPLNWNVAYTETIRQIEKMNFEYVGYTLPVQSMKHGKEKTYKVTPLMGKDLFFLIENPLERIKFLQLSGKERLQLSLQFITQLKKMHDAGYIHCDINPCNVLINLNANPKTIHIIDFEFVKRTDEPDVMSFFSMGTAHFLCPPAFAMLPERDGYAAVSVLSILLDNTCLRKDFSENELRGKRMGYNLFYASVEKKFVYKKISHQLIFSSTELYAQVQHLLAAAKENNLSKRITVGQMKDRLEEMLREFYPEHPTPASSQSYGRIGV